LLLSLFCYRYADHRHLHSFPTRRSSDLHKVDRTGVTKTALPAALTELADTLQEARFVLAGDGRVELAALRDRLVDDLANHAARRSEEHTSELQSRENLVCRLLLEKKKIK